MKGSGISRRTFIQALTAGGAAWAVGFRPARGLAKGPAGESLKLVFFTDVHARLEWETPRALEMAARAINKEKADLLIGGGDFITEGFDATAEMMEPRWRLVEEFIGSLDGPLYPAIGNHDLVAVAPADGSAPSADPRARFRQAFGRTSTRSSFDAGGRHFFLLDAIEIPGLEHPYRGYVDEAQQAWIRDELQAVAPETPIVLVTHMPLLTPFYQATEGGTAAAPENRVIVNSHEVLSLFEEHSLALVLQGHLHVEEHLRRRGVTFLTGGAVCGKWWRGPWHGTPEGFMVVTLRGNDIAAEYKTYGWEARRPAGE